MHNRAIFRIQEQDIDIAKADKAILDLVITLEYDIYILISSGQEHRTNVQQWNVLYLSIAVR